MALKGSCLLHAGVFGYDVTKFEFFDSFLGHSDSYVTPAYEIPSVSTIEGNSLSESDFDSIIRRGIPTVFRGVVNEWTSLKSLSCADYSTRWPDAVMRAEYAGTPGEAFVKLSDKWANSTRVPEGVNSPADDCDSKEAADARPVLAPYVFHVKDRVKKSIKTELGNMYPGFPWKTSKLLDAHIRDTFEFWFQPVGAGTFAHNDAYCHSVFSVQLRGTKKWRFMMVPPADVLSTDVFDEFDSGIYSSPHKWEPDFEVVLNEGDGVLFAPGFMHETRTLSGPSSADKCGTSLTFNIPLGMPTKLIRTFLPRFSVSRELHNCMGRWQSFATLRTNRVSWDTPGPKSDKPREIADDILGRIDIDNNQIVELHEIESYLVEGKFLFKKTIDFGDVFFAFSPRENITPEMQIEAMKLRAIDTLNMWDLNEDGVATREEIIDLLAYFHYYEYRQGIVDKSVVFDIGSGNVYEYPPGSEEFIQGLKIAELIMEQAVPSGPPTLDTKKYKKFSTMCLEGKSVSECRDEL